jgi:hypothetical protein
MLLEIITYIKAVIEDLRIMRRLRGSIICTLPDNGGYKTHLVKLTKLEQMGYLLDNERGLLIKQKGVSNEN